MQQWETFHPFPTCAASWASLTANSIIIRSHCHIISITDF
jgi:hypothetical protein